MSSYVNVAAYVQVPSTGHSLILQFSSFSSLSLVTLLLITLGHQTCCAVLSVLILGTGSASIVAGESPEPAHLGQALQKRWRMKAKSACSLPHERTVVCVQMGLLMFSSGSPVTILALPQS